MTPNEMLSMIAQLRRERNEAKADAAALADKLSGLELRSTELELRFTEELARLEQERDEARQQLRIAVGLLSTLPQFANKHPEDVLDFVKEDTKCLVCTPAEKCWECADDTSLKEGAK
jgi:septal ring factor EnvC (AmiA/AmiB activator)